MTKQEEISLILYSVKIGSMDEDSAMKALDKLGVVIKRYKGCKGCSLVAVESLIWDEG